ncbi:MAG: arginine--tRNA ligase [Tissierellia bacterium]|nr:arginine--tRNA ligase [Tissierellia bacterium]
MFDYKEGIVSSLDGAIEALDADTIGEMLEIPPQREMGDYAFPTFTLAKVFRKSPNQIAAELKEQLGEVPAIEEIRVQGPYLNFFIDKDHLAREVLEDLRRRGEDFGKVDVGQNRQVVMEYSSPNIAKPFHIGHIRTTVIGDSLKRIYDYLGYNTVSINHLGDYGTQFGMMINAYLKWGDPEVIEKNPIPELVKLYVRINKEAEENPELLDESRNWFKRLEEQDEEAVALWQWFRDVSLKEFKRVYELLDIEFDSYRGESFYTDLMPEAVEEMKEKGILVESKGAQIVNLDEYKLPPAIIIKSDGSTIYLTRDIATALYRKKTYDFYKSVYVVASQQNLHFQQLFAILDKMGHEWVKDCEHVSFGMVSLKDGTLSTRRGKVVYLEDVLKRATDKVEEILIQREEETGKAVENRRALAQTVGIGAVKFQELFNQRIKDYVFDWDRTLSFDGETGPYVQYTHARIASLLEKGNFQVDGPIKIEELDQALAHEILAQLYGFHQVVVDAHEKNEPYFITRYIVETAKLFNKYYNSTPIITEDAEATNTRLFLSYGVKTLIKVGLSLLGIGAPEKM